MPEVVRITTSSKSLCQDCPFAYWLAYVRCFSPLSEPIYFTHGHWMHRALGAYKESGSDLGAAVKEVQAIEQETEEAFKGKSAEEIDLLGSTLEALTDIVGAYHLRWHEQDKFYETLAVEHTFALDLPMGEDTLRFEGRIDSLARDTRDGSVLPWEMKTPARTGPWYYERLVLDPQCRGYILAMQRKTGFNIRSVMYDIIKKPQIKPTAGETPEIFARRLGDTYLSRREELFERTIITPPERLIREYEKELTDFGKELQWRTAENHWPRNHPGNRFGRCTYFMLCVEGAEHLYKQRPKEAFFPELVSSEEGE